MEATQPFAFMLHGSADGNVSSFYYGIERQEVITLLEKIVEDYRKIEKESKEITTLEFKGEPNGNRHKADRKRSQVSDRINLANQVSRNARRNRANSLSFQKHTGKT